MLWILATILWLIRNLVSEFILFIVVDVVAKSPLRDAANYSEKRMIWLWEAGVLLGISCVIYWLDHTPYLLMSLAGATGIYTQLYGRIHIRQWWNTLCTRWEEYQQHEESMRQVQAHLARQQTAVMQPQTASGSPSLASFSAPSTGMPPHMLPSQRYPPNVTLLARQEIPGMTPCNRGPVFRSSQGGLIWSGMSQANSSAGGYFSQQSSVSTANTARRENVAHPVNRQVTLALQNGASSSSLRWFGGDLRRRPLRQYDNLTTSPSPGNASSGASIKHRFMNALGFGDSVRKPPGLKNKGQNQCFMNSVLQCLARSPYLTQFLAVDAAKELEGTVSECLFLSSLSELLDLLTVEQDTSDVSVLDPTRFRQAAAALNKSLVAPVGQPQMQQDAAEFLMWMLSTVHNILNKNRQALSCGADSGNEEVRFSSPRLAKLRFIYGDLTPAKAKELKDVCLREIELANGLENDSYAESIQRLSDLEWLLHKQSNESIVDDLFTGQLVEALCTFSNRISVTLQTFSVLPVPLAAPRPMSGLVMLEDCFTAFCNIENLVNSDFSLKNTKLSSAACDGVALGSAVTPLPPGPRTRSNGSHLNLRGNSMVPAPLSHIQAVVSPIVGHRDPSGVNDSGFCDSAFRTSTPIREVVGGVLAVEATVQRRCLLRQLPECLIIQLLRFSYNLKQGRSTKLTAPVSVRLKGLDLQDLVYDTVTQQEDFASPSGVIGPQVYDLYGLCLHMGGESTHHGHYVSYSLAADGHWYRFDDELVTEVNMEYELTTKEVRQNVYILFYKRAVG